MRASTVAMRLAGLGRGILPGSANDDSSHACIITPYAPSLCGLKLLVYAALRFYLVYAALSYTRGAKVIAWCWPMFQVYEALRY